MRVVSIIHTLFILTATEGNMISAVVKTCRFSDGNIIKVCLCLVVYRYALREKCPYSELFWSAFFHIWNEYGEIRYHSLFSPNAGKCGPE